jgi:hypothetical protein
MDTSRRHAIRLGLCATASLVALPGLGESVAAAGQKHTLAVASDEGAFLRRDLFESHVGEAIVVSNQTTATTVWLTRVDDQRDARRSGTEGDEHNFVVVFRGLRSPKLAQGTYQIQSRSLGSFELFLVPERSTAPGTTYTATFSRLP